MRPPEIFIIRDQPIALEEWKALISHLAEWDLPEIVHCVTLDGKEISSPGKGFAWWNGHSSGQPVPFDFADGRIRLTEPDHETVTQASKIASLLNATVVSEEGKKL